MQENTQILRDALCMVQRTILHECEVPAHFLKDLKYLLLVRIGLVYPQLTDVVNKLYASPMVN